MLSVERHSDKAHILRSTSCFTPVKHLTSVSIATEHLDVDTIIETMNESIQERSLANVKLVAKCFVALLNSPLTVCPFTGLAPLVTPKMPDLVKGPFHVKYVKRLFLGQVHFLHIRKLTMLLGRISAASVQKCSSVTAICGIM